MNATLELLLSHRSIRVYGPEPVPDEHVTLAVRAGQMASTSSAVQAYSVIRVRDRAARAELAALSGGQSKVADAPVFLVVCGDTRRQRLAGRRDGHGYDQRLEAFLVSAIDAALFAEKMSIAFEALGYGICYIGGVRNDLPGVTRVLGLPEGVYPYFGLCVGVPAEDPGQRPRLPTAMVLHEERYPSDEQVLSGMLGYDEAYVGYLAERGAKDLTPWSRRLGAKSAAPERPGLGAYYSSRGARLE